LSTPLFVLAFTCQQNGLPLILNGDITQQNILDYPTLQMLQLFLSRFRDLDIYINVGNHDLDGDNNLLSPLIELSDNKRHMVISEPKTKRILDCNFCFVPFMKEDVTSRHLRQLSKELNDNETNILIIHNTFAKSIFSNSRKSYSGIDQNAKYLRIFDLIAASHIHKYQDICLKRGFYTSSIIPLNFGEDQIEHGFHIVDLKKRIRYFVIPKAPRFVYINASQISEKSAKLIKGNIVCIINDKKEIDRETVKKKILQYKPNFITFRKKNTTNSMKQPLIKDSKKVEDIISEYSKVLSKKYKLNKDMVEQHGLEILGKVRKSK
jgi:DNA repair exonuclease SbcCD nuclease subunit